MKYITMTMLRAEPGERMIDIRRDRQSFTVTHNGKPAALLTPLEPDRTIIESDGRIRGEMPLTFRRPELVRGS